MVYIIHSIWSQFLRFDWNNNANDRLSTNQAYAYEDLSLPCNTIKRNNEAFNVTTDN